MKKITPLFIGIFLLFAANSFSQINFEHGSFAEIKAKAKTEHKLIFIDAFTTWCGPCKWMAKNVFTNDTVASFFNKTFVNAKIDMEAGEGLEIAKIYKINVYPSLLFINENGDLIHRVAGSRSSADFIQLGKDALIPEKQFSTIEKKYMNGNREGLFISSYLNILSGSGLDTRDVLSDYLNSQKESDLSSSTNWNIIYSHLNDNNSKTFNYLMKNAELFSKLHTADSVNNKIFYVYSDALNNLIYARTPDSVKIFNLKKEIQNSGFKRGEEVLLDADLNYYQNKQDYNNFAKTAVIYIDKYKSTDVDFLNNIAYTFYTEVKDKGMLEKAESWAKKSYELNPHPQFNMDTYACLLALNGKKKEAIELEKKAIEIIKNGKEKYDQSAIAAMQKQIDEWSMQ
ncbi:MAG: hypothetical protein K0S44_475 [Bacteroidetes bacterium]|jgi:thiol-disulfide isomerase/thioredoxin|nr:hypothetical protein [Bacteroidota bacterium]